MMGKKFASISPSKLFHSYSDRDLLKYNTM